jgi:calcium-dependent protein kinase
LITGESKTVKIYRKIELQSEALEMVRKEVNFLRACDHPNIIKVFDLFEDEAKIYLVCEDITGESLFDYTIKKRQLTEKDINLIAAQIISVIKYTHSQFQTIIRCIKPETVVFAEPNAVGDIRICDFFFAIKADQIALEKPSVIDDVYKSPDSLFQGKKVFNPKHDYTFTAPELLPAANIFGD